jgi:hypothetical protein
MYYDNTYFLATEFLNGAIWQTYIFSSTSPTGPFSPLPGNPVLNDGDACFFQQVFTTTLHAYSCKLTGSTWTMEYRTADLSAGRPLVPYLNSGKWTPGGLETWSAQFGSQPNGTAGIVAQLQGDQSRTGSQVLLSNYSGTDYIADAALQLTAGRVLGLGARVTDQDNLYSSNLYEDLDGGNNLYNYLWVNNGALTLGTAAAGQIDFNTWYKMTVKAHGANIDVLLNDNPILSATDPFNQYPAGRVALLGEGETTARYNDLRVRKYASADPLTTVGGEGPTAIVLNTLTAQTTQAAPSWLIIGILALGGVGIVFFRQLRRK